nr:MAG TPA: hypothetical protein [Crassvirales sp.]
MTYKRISFHFFSFNGFQPLLLVKVIVVLLI